MSDMSGNDLEFKLWRVGYAPKSMGLLGRFLVHSTWSRAEAGFSGEGAIYSCFSFRSRSLNTCRSPFPCSSKQICRGTLQYISGFGSHQLGQGECGNRGEIDPLGLGKSDWPVAPTSCSSEREKESGRPRARSRRHGGDFTETLSNARQSYVSIYQ
jgi:hypothetical protein